MDILAHGLWTNVIYKALPNTRNNKKTGYWGVFFGIFPDLFSFTPVFAYIFYRLIFFGQKISFAPPEDINAQIPLAELTKNLYNYSHSLVVWIVIFALAWAVIKRIPWVLLGWGLHIGLDIFSHTSAFFPTPFLFPIFRFNISGWSWAEPAFMIVNYGLLLILYLFVIPKLKKN